MTIPESPQAGVEGPCREMAPAGEAAGQADGEWPRALQAGAPPPDYMEKTMDRLFLAAGVKSMREVGNLLQWDQVNEDEDKAVVAVEFAARFIVWLRVSPLFVFLGQQPMRIPTTTPLRENEVEQTLALLFGQDPVRRWKEAGRSVSGLLTEGRKR